MKLKRERRGKREAEFKCLALVTSNKEVKADERETIIALDQLISNARRLAVN